MERKMDLVEERKHGKEGVKGWLGVAVGFNSDAGKI